MSAAEAPAFRAYMLVGPTAAGKTAVANALARRMGAIVLSADSMLVYRGMDVGTAKPSAEDLAGVDFRGADLAFPNEEFSAGRWLCTAREAAMEARRDGRALIVAGGTGLYVNALIRGLDAPAPQDPALRAELERLPPEALRARAEALFPGAAGALPDPRNPRRLVRLIEKLSAARGGGSGWTRAQAATPGTVSCTHAVVAGLDAAPEALAQRIAARVDAMFAGGLLAEAARLRREFPEFSRTAGKGIGYAEALAALDGVMTEAQARERIALRTRQLAKRQRAWFRRQLSVRWVESPADESGAARAADEVKRIWDESGATPLAC